MYIFDWLKTHYSSIKNFLEIVYFISAAFVPVILGIITFKFSKEIHKRDEYQLMLSKVSNMLLLNIIVKTREGIGEENLHEELHILKEKYVSLKKTKIEYQTFVELIVSENYKKVLIPVYGYYGNKCGNLLQGNKVVIFPHKENRKFFSDLYREFSVINQREKPTIYVNPEIKTYIKIEYTNKLEDSYTDCYLADSFGYIELSEEENIKLQQKLSAEKEDFYSLTAKNLWNRFIQLNDLDTMC